MPSPVHFLVKTVPATLAVSALGLLLAPAPTRAQSSVSQHLTMGNPSGATASTSNPSNYLIVRAQYALSYSRYDGIPNWVSWHLGKSDQGSSGRGAFQPDTSLPSGWYRVTTNDYTGSGYDRGHNCPSGDRTSTTTDNAAVFLMSNIMPQAADNNQGPWEQLESYCRDLLSQGRELYIVSGVSGKLGTIAGGKVTIPATTWKVVVVLPEGSNDLSRVTSTTRVICVSMPNRNGIFNNDWRQYRISVRQLEKTTGYNFLSLVPTAIQNVIENRVDSQ